MKWHHYMGRLTDKSSYTKEAERMSKVVWKEMKEVSTDEGTALVWPRGVLSTGSSEDYLMPQTYARYVVEDAMTFTLRGSVLQRQCSA